MTTPTEIKHLKRPNFISKNGKIYLVRCQECGLENYGPAVASGQCVWCGTEYKALCRHGKTYGECGAQGGEACIIDDKLCGVEDCGVRLENGTRVMVGSGICKKECQYNVKTDEVFKYVNCIAGDK